MTDEHHRRQTDQILDGWTWGRVKRIGSALIILGGLYAGATTYIASRFASRQEIENHVQPVADTLNLFKRSATARMDRIEIQQTADESVHRLLIPMARLQCLQMERWQSTTLAFAAGLPCDSLLRRMRR